MDKQHHNDHTIFTGVNVVCIFIETGELHLFDKYVHGFRTSELDFELLKNA